jgi:hypothetical protein
MESITCLVDGKPISMDDVLASSKGFGRVVPGLPSWKYEVRIPTEMFVRSVGPLFKRFVDLELADDEEIDDQDLLALRQVGGADLRRSLLVDADLTRRVMKRFLGMEIADAFTSADQESLPRKVFVLQTLDEINLVSDAVLLFGLAYPARA